MSENKLSRKERLVLSIKARIRELVNDVQDDGAHLRFKPGYCWWIATLGPSAMAGYPAGVHFCDQIGVSQEDFKYAVGERWLTSKEFPFSALRSGKVGQFTFVTVDLIHPSSDYGSHLECPAADSSLIVSSSSWSTSLCVKQLLRSIEERVRPIPVQQPTLMQQEPENTTAQPVPPPAIASKRTEIPQPRQQTPSDHQLEVVATNPFAKEARRRELMERLELMLVESMALRKEAELYKGKGNTDILKLSSNIAYEHVTFMQQASGQKDSVLLRPPNAGGSTWTREISSRGGTSKRTQRRKRYRDQERESKY
jgi:hypothetical protein